MTSNASRPMRTVALRTESRTASVLTSHGVTVAYRHPTPSAPAQEWACAGRDPEQFFPTDEATLADAVAVCGTCVLRDTCLDLGLSRAESGVWGGALLQGGKVLERVPVRGRPTKARSAA